MTPPTYDPLCAEVPGCFPPPQGLDELKATYGDIAIANGEVITPGWEITNMMVAREPWLPNGKIYVHKKAWPLFKAAFEECLALNDGYAIKTLGCFAPRPKRVNGDISTHSWGIAMDLNAATNPLAAEPGGTLISDIPATWIDLFESLGFTWGGRWHRPDAMHFQFVTSY